MTSSIANNPASIANAQIREFFLDSVSAALDNQGVQVQGGTVHYVADLLTRFARSSNFYEETEEGVGLRPLAEYYGQAISGRSRREQARALRRLGDVALFISGLLSGSLNRKIVDVDYYIAMGGSAYGQLSMSVGGGFIGDGQQIFGELAEKFTAFVDVLDEVGEGSAGKSDVDVMRAYELWLKTGSRRAARRLNHYGIVPMESAGSRRHH